MLLVVAYSEGARQALRNVCNRHEAAVVRRFGRAVLLEATQLGAFVAIRLRAGYGGDVQVEETQPFNEFASVPDEVREAAAAFAERESESTPYHAFRAGTAYPSKDGMRGEEL